MTKITYAKQLAVENSQFNVPLNDKCRTANFIESYADWIVSLSENARLFFVTYTFKDTSGDVPYDEYRWFFHYQYVNLLKAVRVHRKKYKPVLVLVPEKSYKGSLVRLMVPLHFHGFLVIHDRGSTKFDKAINLEKKLDSQGQVIFKSDAEWFLNPYKSKHKGYRLDIYEHDIKPIEKTVLDIERICSYQTKSLFREGFTFDDIILHG